MVNSFFVYGTLKRGQLRERFWPVEPKSVQPAIVRATLYDRADYPAMTPGDDWVLGECWVFAAAHVDQVLAVLDRVEGTNQPGQPDLYYRDLVPVMSLSQQPLGVAHVYFYVADPSEEGFIRMKSAGRGQVSWPADE